MSPPNAFAVPSLELSIVLVVVSLTLGCTLDDHPSLGRYDEITMHNPFTRDASMSPANLDPSQDASAGRGSSTGRTSSAGATGTPEDAALAGRDAAQAQVDASKPVVPVTRDAGTAIESACREGVYLGSFNCSVDTAMSVIALPGEVMTQATLTLRKVAPNRLEIARGSLGYLLNGFMFTADFSGQLDCALGTFHADLVNGVFASMLAPIPATFSGTADGTLDSGKQNLSGTWSFTGDNTDATCRGSWSAAFQP